MLDYTPAFLFRCEIRVYTAEPRTTCTNVTVSSPHSDGRGTPIFSEATTVRTQRRADRWYSRPTHERTPRFLLDRENGGRRRVICTGTCRSIA